MYLLFSGADYYPIGGAQDLDGVFETLEQAKEAVADRQWHGQEGNGSWSHIYGIKEIGIVWEFTDYLPPSRDKSWIYK